MANENGWTYCEIGNIAAPVKNALVGGPFGSNLVSSDYVSAGVPVIRGRNMGFGRWVGGDFAYVTNEKAESLSSNLARPGDLVLTQRGTLGQVAIVPENPFDTYVISQSQMKLTIDQNKSNPLFLYYVFTSPQQQEYIRQHSIQTGVPHTNLGILRDTPIFLPSLSEQQAIAGILGALDDKIELNLRMNETLQAMTRTIFKSWFVDFDPVRAKLDGCQPPGMDTETAALFPERFEHVDQGEIIPAGWSVRRLDDLASLRSGGTPSKKNSDYWGDEVPWISAKDMKQQRLFGAKDYLTEQGSENGTKVVPSGAILVLVRGMTLHKDVPICLAMRPMAFNQDVKAIVPHEPQMSQFCLLTLLSSKYDLLKSVDAASHGTGRINTDTLRNLECVVPDHDALDAFNRIVDPISERLRINDEQSFVLAHVRDSLLPKLLSGEIRVADAEKEVIAALSD